MNTSDIVNKVIDIVMNTEIVYELNTNEVSIVYQEYTITIKF